MKHFGSCSGQGVSALNMTYPFSLLIFHDLLPSNSCPLILLSDFPSRDSGKVVCRRSMMSNGKVGACVGWSWGS